MADYLAVNRANWDERAPAHAASPDYELARYSREPDHLSGVIRFDRPRLGEVAGLDGIHLQCHLGTDTVSLARLGARMTGLDFSAPALERARALAAAMTLEVDFVQAEVHDAVQAVQGRQFDLVYTGIGALCWLPGVRRWAAVVAALLRPGGRLFLREGHPVLWAVDETRTDGALALDYPYFEQDEPLIWTESGTYVQTDHAFTHTTTHQWNHGLGELVTALLAEGLTLTRLEEHDSAPWDALPGRTRRDERGEYQLTERPWRLPMTYTLEAVKPGPVR